MYAGGGGGAGGAGGDQNFDYMFKILIIGNSSVGKTSFLFRYCDDRQVNNGNLFKCYLKEK